MLKAERDANVCRKPFSTIEALELGRRLEALLASPAAERRREGWKQRGRNGKSAHGHTAEPCDESSQGSAPKTRDTVAKAVGMSPSRYEQGKAVRTDDPVAYVLSLNLHRRQLDPSQLAIVGAKARAIYDRQAKERQMAGQQRGGETAGKGRPKQEDSSPENLPDSSGDARDHAGAAVGVSGKSIDHATKVLEKGVQILRAEHDENEHRKPFSAYEALVMGRKLKAIFKPEADAKKQEGNRRGGKASGATRRGDGGNVEVPVNLTGTSAPAHTRDRVAKAVGMSSGRYSQEQEVLDAAEAIEAGMKLEALLAPAADERQQAGRVKGGKNKAAKAANAKNGVLLGDKLSPSSHAAPQTRELVGQAMGIGAMTYQKGKAVFTAAEQDPKKFGDL